MNSDPDNPEILRSVPSELEATAIVAALTDRGIHAKMTGGYTAGFRAESPGQVHIIVKRQDLERAREALQTIEQSETIIDWSQVDVGESEDT